MQEVDLRDLPKIDMLVAGLPCVGASRSGKSKNGIAAAEEHPTAGALFFTFLRVAKELNPSIICLENVVEYGKELSATVIRTALSEWGYDLYEMTVGGNEFGALEDRKRLCILAITKQCPIDVSKLVPIRDKEATLGEVMETIDPDSDAWKSVSYLYDKAERDTAAGKGFKMQQVGPDSEKVGTIGAGYAKIRSTEPMIAHPDPARKGTVRLLTPAEHAAVKAIPRGLVDGISNTLAHKILGNSCVFPAFQAVGVMLGSQISAHVASLPDRTVSASEAAAPVARDVVVEASAGREATTIPAAAVPRVVEALASATQEKGGLRMSTIARSLGMLKPGRPSRPVAQAQVEMDLENEIAPRM